MADDDNTGVNGTGEAEPEPLLQPSFVLSSVDEPQSGTRLLPGMSLSGRGWAVSASPIELITIHLGELLLGYAQHGQPRPEIGQDFPDYPQSHHAGFVFSVKLGPEIAAMRGADLAIRFRTEDGGRGERRVSLNWAEDEQVEASRPWPIRLALDICRIDAGGRLNVRGWAIGRSPVTSLRLFLNDTRLEAPQMGLSRPDIAARHPGYEDAAQAGFRLRRPVRQPPPGSVVRVVARAGGVQRQIVVPLATAESETGLCCETVMLDADGTLTVAGWALSEAETRRIELRGPNGLRVLARLGLPRPDLVSRFPRLPGAAHSGFLIRTEAAGLTAGSLVELVVHDADERERRLALRMPDQTGADDATDGQDGSMSATRRSTRRSTHPGCATA